MTNIWCWFTSIDSSSHLGGNQVAAVALIVISRVFACIDVSSKQKKQKKTDVSDMQEPKMFSFFFFIL